MNLKTKFRLASSALIISVVTGMMLSLYSVEKKQLRRDFEQEQQADLTKLAGVCEQALLTLDEPLLLNYSKSLMMSPIVAYAGFIDPLQGTGWLYSVKSKFVPIDFNGDESIRPILRSNGLLRRHVHVDADNITELSIPVKSRGYVRLGYSEEALDILFQDNIKHKLKRFLVVGLVSILFGLLMSELLGMTLIKPIALLMQAAESVGRGEKNIQIPVASHDEVGRLTKTFNVMTQELGKLDQLKDDFMSHVTHELRSPLTSIIATIELMSEMQSVNQDMKLKRSVDRLSYGSERLNRLVDNILDLMRMKAGKMFFDIQPVSLPILLTEMADFFEPQAVEKGLEIRAKVPMAFPLVMADPERIRQVISNLMHNAIKFTNRGTITLWIQQRGEMAEIGIQDTGVGIPKELVGRIFGKFEMLNDTRNRVDKPVPGSGLGLNIVQASIKEQKGTIRVVSDVDQGSCFIFTLPLAPEKIQKKYMAPMSAEFMARQPTLIDFEEAHDPQEKAISSGPLV